MIRRQEAAALVGIALLACGGPLPARAQTSQPARVEIGFGLGPVSRARKYAPALRRVYADGFRVMRVYEPFVRGDGGMIAPIVRQLQYLDSLGFTPYFDVSDFPHALDTGDRAAATFPAGKRDPLFEHTNRYPPASPQLDSLMSDLIAQFDHAFGRARLLRWYFEFGNEPDAASFFWGSPEDFARLLHVAVARYHAYDPTLTVGGGAFTAGVVRRPASRARYAALARELADSHDAFVSFHVYAGLQPWSDLGAAINALLGPPAGRLRVISEWNVSSRADRATAAVLSSPDAVGPYLIDLLAGAADGGVGLVLVHKLMDEPGEEQLGLFDAAGRPKASYDLVRQAVDFARRGFTVARSDDGGVRLEGATLTWVEAGQNPVQIDPRTYTVVAPAGAGRIPAHGWALLRRRGATDAQP